MKILILPLILLFPVLAIAHDTTHIHPMITKRVSDLIKQEDLEQSYLELYLPHKTIDQRGLYWGKDRDLEDPSLTLDELLEDNLSLYGSATPPLNVTHYNNVMDGVVQEDAPASKVLNHFYHALTGDALTLNGVTPLGGSNPSALTAMAYFNRAISWYNGYDEKTKKRAYFIFGQSLHHVEDMSSPAHIHNDPHLTFFNSVLEEKDDYEGWFLPTQKRNPASNGAGTKVDEFFGRRITGSGL